MSLFRRAALRILPSVVSPTVFPPRPAISCNVLRLSLTPRLTAPGIHRLFNTSEILRQSSLTDGIESVRGAREGDSSGTVDTQAGPNVSAVTGQDGRAGQIVDATDYSEGERPMRPAERSQSSYEEESALSAEEEEGAFTYNQRPRGRGSYTARRDSDYGDSAGPHSGRREMREPSPRQTVVILNLFFDVTAEDLENLMKEYGTVQHVKLMQDDRGLSRGFGYCQYDSVEAATRAREALTGTIFEGRKIAVRYATRNIEGRNFSNPPSRTLFVGNLAYDMTDQDLQGIFKDVPNVYDVRVAIDRRTGQPRGFLHAEFLDIESARIGYEMLEGKSFHGRTLRLDYSNDVRRASQVQGSESE